MATISIAQPTVNRDQLLLTGRGMISQNFDNPESAGGSTMGSQVIQGMLVPLALGDVVTGLVFGIAAAGTSTAPTGIYAALYSSGGTRLAVSANLNSSSIWTAAANVKVKAAFTGGAYTATADGCYYACFLQDGAFGGTALQLFRSANAAFVGAVVASGLAPYVTQSGQATMPTPSATFVTAANPVPWVGTYT